MSVMGSRFRSFHLINGLRDASTEGKTLVTSDMKAEFQFWIVKLRDPFFRRSFRSLAGHLTATTSLQAFADATPTRFGLYLPEVKGEVLKYQSASGVIPHRLTQNIALGEAYACKMLCGMLDGNLKDFLIKLRIDNKVVVAGMKKGRSRNEDLNRILKECDELLERKGLMWQVEYIRSELNPADEPSRASPVCLSDPGFQKLSREIEIFANGKITWDTSLFDDPSSCLLPVRKFCAVGEYSRNETIQLFMIRGFQSKEIPTFTHCDFYKFVNDRHDYHGSKPLPNVWDYAFPPFSQAEASIMHYIWSERAKYSNAAWIVPDIVVSAVSKRLSGNTIEVWAKPLISRSNRNLLTRDNLPFRNRHALSLLLFTPKRSSQESNFEHNFRRLL